MKKTLLLKEKRNHGKKIPHHTFSCAQIAGGGQSAGQLRIWRFLAQQVSLCSGKNKRCCSGGANKQAIGG
jgi:hypothetical protein